MAGAEAAWQAARLGADVTLHEMKPHRFSPAHTSPSLAELVCSNSLRADFHESAVGLLKEELRMMGSLIMDAADKNAVPAGRSLAVDREGFADFVTQKIESHPLITLVRKEIKRLNPGEPVIIATGPLTSGPMADVIADLTEPGDLFFYDAVSPIVFKQSIDFTKAFQASRYEEGPGDYVNCPMTEEEYRDFFTELTSAEQVPLRSFEEKRFFEGCLPIEVMAERGYQTLLFGPMKPVGLINPHTGTRPYAVVQLRQDDREGTLFNMVGFQTKLRHPEQLRVFRMIPGLEAAEFARLGSIHRNTFINSPKWLTAYLNLRNAENIFFAGQITGVEGYVESTAMGMLSGINAFRYFRGEKLITPPQETAMGGLVRHITTRNKDFQPMNINFGLFPVLNRKVPKKARRKALADRAIEELETWRSELK